MFILSGGGKLNYLGSKNWIEQQMEKSNTLQVNTYYFLIYEYIVLIKFFYFAIKNHLCFRMCHLYCV